MALIISFVNRSNLEEVSNYDVDVWVNDRKIAGTFKVRGHRRSDGWEALVKRFVEDVIKKA